MRDSIKVRAAIELRIKQLALKNTELSKLSGIPPKWIGSWRNGNNSALTQFDLIKLANSVGIELDIQILFR